MAGMLEGRHAGLKHLTHGHVTAIPRDTSAACPALPCLSSLLSHGLVTTTPSRLPPHPHPLTQGGTSASTRATRSTSLSGG